MKLLRFFYNLVFPFVLVALLPSFLFRMLKRGKYRHKFGQRFALYSPRVRAKLSAWAQQPNSTVGTATWVHAVSVGEVLIALKFIREMKRHEPDLRIVLSTTTSTGFALASKEKSDWLEPIYNPIDFYWIAKRAIRLIRPCRLILVEAEIWPNLTAEAKAAGAPLILINARLSKRSEGRYRLVRPFAAMLFNQLDLLCVQEPADAERWFSLGVETEKILCPGSIKFDDGNDASRVRRDFWPELKKLGVKEGAPILLGGSTHSGEEQILGEITLRLRREFPDLFYIAVPRHAERWREVRDELVKLGFHVALRSEQLENPRLAIQNATALLANTTGELRDWYDCATVVFVGKSLTAHGGQNPAEAIAANKAVVFGPNMENFATISSQFVREQAALQAADSAALERAVRDLLESPAKREALAAAGKRCLEIHRGATTRTCEAIRALP